MENDKMKTPRASQSRVSEKRPVTWATSHRQYTLYELPYLPDEP